MSLSKSERPLAEAFGALYRSPQSISYAIVDAFVGEHCRGSPAAVVILSEWKDDEWMQDVASEFNIANTAYLVKKGELKKVAAGEGTENGAKDDSDSGIHEYDIRWFTPEKEATLCGHATLATAHLLYSNAIVNRKDTIYFHSKGGLLSTRVVGLVESDAPNASSEEGEKTPLVEISFPWVTTTPCADSVLEALPGTLGDREKVVAVGRANHLIVELESSEDVENLQPKLEELMNLEGDGLIATAPGGQESGFDFVSRCFFPKLGLFEDPVCGSAHAILGPYWSTKLGRNDLLAKQVSKRGGTLALKMDKKIGRVYIRGQATIAMAGVIVQ